MGDVLAVMDAAGSGRAALLGHPREPLSRSCLQPPIRRVRARSRSMAATPTSPPGSWELRPLRPLRGRSKAHGGAAPPFVISLPAVSKTPASRRGGNSLRAFVDRPDRGNRARPRKRADRRPACRSPKFASPPWSCIEPMTRGSRSQAAAISRKRSRARASSSFPGAIIRSGPATWIASPTKSKSS